MQHTACIEIYGTILIVLINHSVILLEVKMADGAASSTSTTSSPTAPTSSSRTPQQNPLSKKLTKILESNLDNDRDTLEALEVLSGFLEKNTLQVRRNLRSDLEKRSLGLNESFLQCVGKLVGEVKGLQEETAAMKSCCDDMQERLAGAKSKTSTLLRETAELQHRSKQLEMKGRVVDAFLHRFDLSPKEAERLASTRDLGVDDAFFSIMERVKRIHEDCKALLRTSQQRAGLEIMEAMAMHLESAYEQLYHWTQGRCRVLNLEYPDINRNLCRALQELKQRPILYQYCIDEYNIARRMSLVRLFIDALTRDGDSGRPIELHSHDPLRYCSDMLGWLHQAIATENDHINSLLRDPECEKAVAMLGVITEGACRPLHMRIEQVVVSISDAVVAYQLVNLLRYYSGVFQDLLGGGGGGGGAPLVQTVGDLTELQSKMLFSTLNVQTSKILEAMEPPLSHLAATPTVNEMLSLLQKILASRDMNSLASGNQERDLKLILSTCIDPVVQHCSESALRLSRLEKAVFMTNCLYVIQSTVSLYEFTEHQLEILEAQIQIHLKTIVSEQFAHFIGITGISDVYSAAVNSQLTDQHFEALEKCLQKLKLFSSAADEHQLAQCRLLLGLRLREEVQRGALELFLEAYTTVFNAVLAEKGDDYASTHLPHTPDQLKLLLS